MSEQRKATKIIMYIRNRKLRFTSGLITLSVVDIRFGVFRPDDLPGFYISVDECKQGVKFQTFRKKCEYSFRFPQLQFFQQMAGFVLYLT